MNCSVSGKFKMRLESNEIALEAVDQGVQTLGCERVSEGKVGEIGIVQGIIATNSVRDGIRDYDVCETAVGELVVVIGIAPAAQAAGWVGVEERAVAEVRRVCCETS